MHVLWDAGGGGSLHLEWELMASRVAVSLGKPRRLAQPIPLPVPHPLKGTRPPFWDEALSLVNPPDSWSDFIDHINTAPRLQGLQALPFPHPMPNLDTHQAVKQPMSHSGDGHGSRLQDANMPPAAEPEVEMATASARDWAPKHFWILRSDAAGTLHLHAAKFPGPYPARMKRNGQPAKQRGYSQAEKGKSKAVEGPEGGAAAVETAAREAALAAQRAREGRVLELRRVQQSALLQIKKVFAGQQKAARQEASARMPSGTAMDSHFQHLIPPASLLLPAVHCAALSFMRWS